MAKPLYKLREGRIISGVCAGLAEYFNIDVNIVRICAVLIGCAGGAGVIAYIAAKLCKQMIYILIWQQFCNCCIFYATKHLFFGISRR